jgi:Na+/H+-dicarboxylate symporter
MDAFLSAMRAVADFAIEVLLLVAFIFLANSLAYYLLGEENLMLAIVIGTGVACVIVLAVYPYVSRSWNTRLK